MELCRKNLVLTNCCKAIILSLFGALICYLVFLSGGTSGSWAQLNFIPIILAAYFWKEIGSLIFSISLGLINGPFMPLDRIAGEPQTFLNWFFRLMIYVLIGLITAYIFRKNEQYDKIIKENYLRNQFNELYNTNKLFIDLDKKINENNNFHLIYININNISDISKYVNYDIIKEIDKFITKTIKQKFNNITIYSASESEYILIVDEYDDTKIQKELHILLKTLIKSINIYEFDFKLIIKIGIIKNPKTSFNSVELYNKVRIAADQGDRFDSGIYYYDNSFEKERILYNEISGSLYNAITNNEFYLVYQPVIDIKENNIANTEVLIRWDRGNREPVGPHIFIKIAEEIGLIKLITKWVISNTVENYKNWVEQGFIIKHSINITATELLDMTFLKWANNLFSSNNIDEKNFGLEITERVLSNDNRKLKDILMKLRQIGYIVEIDDFGTGYNSLMFLGEIPTDIIKIDKFFIDRLDQEDVKIMITNIIQAVHKSGSKTIAEGVETKEQYLILKEMGCDMIQGYYFSKPLLAKDFISYHKNFDINNYL